MNRKTKADFITSIVLILYSGIVMLMPLLNITNVKWIFVSIMVVYLISNLINYLLVQKSKDKEGLYTSIISIVGILLAFLLNISLKPVNLALILLIWTFGESLVRLKKADYYHDRENSMWLVLIIVLFIFVFAGLLTTINLYYSSSVQILMLGNFFFINGILDIVDPIANYIKEKK